MGRREGNVGIIQTVAADGTQASSGTTPIDIGYVEKTTVTSTPDPPQFDIFSPPSRLTCAADFGQNHSIAAAFGAQNNFVGNLLGGNTFSNLAYLGQSVFGNRTPTAGDMAGTVLGGAGQGLPLSGPGFQGAAGQASDAIVGAAVSAGYNAITGVGKQTLQLGITASGRVGTVVAPLATTTVSTIVGYANLAKLALDAGTFAYGAIFACH